jgi:cytidylate kinase
MSGVTVVAVDGPAGSGKSSVSKAVARRLGFAYYDTGAAYRALAWAALHHAVNVDDEAALRALYDSAHYVASDDPDDQVFSVDGVDVTEAIRGHQISELVSRIARHPRVREALVELFRSVIRGCEYPGIIMEGRDITTVVAPDATVRVLLTADEEIRIQRRQAELGNPGSQPVAESLKARDHSDQSVVDFMSAAPGVVVLDSGPLSFEETVWAMLQIIGKTVEGLDE